MIFLSQYFDSLDKYLFYSFRSSSAKEKLREESLKYLTKDYLLQIIEEGFEAAKTPVNIVSSH